jgi:predicted ArsR family transcriptional regulator
MALAADSRLDEMFLALSDHRRRRMIEILACGPAQVKDLAAALKLNLPAAVKHLACLEHSQLVHSAKSGRVRTYQLADDAFSDLESWVSARKQAVHDEFDRLDAFLESAFSKGAD